MDDNRSCVSAACFSNNFTERNHCSFRSAAEAKKSRLMPRAAFSEVGGKVASMSIKVDMATGRAPAKRSNKSDNGTRGSRHNEKTGAPLSSAVGEKVWLARRQMARARPSTGEKSTFKPFISSGNTFMEANNRKEAMSA